LVEWAPCKTLARTAPQFPTRLGLAGHIVPGLPSSACWLGFSACWCCSRCLLEFCPSRTCVEGESLDSSCATRIASTPSQTTSEPAAGKCKLHKFTAMAVPNVPSATRRLCAVLLPRLPGPRRCWAFAGIHSLYSCGGPTPLSTGPPASRSVH